jgi:adenylate kinase family enzyme
VDGAAPAGPAPAGRAHPATARRVLVIGSGGAGKSTLARAIGARLGLPVVHLDALYWRAGWVPAPEAEWTATVARLVADEAWVMDGNYGGTMAPRLAACDVAIFLDLPRLVCLWGIVRRALRYRGRTRPDLAAGCPEQLTWEFVRWVWQYPRTRRPGVLQRLAALPPERVRVLRSRREVRRFVAALPASLAVPAAPTAASAPAVGA